MKNNNKTNNSIDNNSNERRIIRIRRRILRSSRCA